MYVYIHSYKHILHMTIYIHAYKVHTIYNNLDLPNLPQFTQCVTYNSGQPALRVSSYVS